MADISTYLRNIEEATLGEQVRGSIRDAIAAINKAVEDGLDETATMVSTPLTAATAADMTDTGKIYVYTGDETGYETGHWYYYDGSEWARGGPYQSATYDYEDLYNKPPIVVVDDDAPEDSRTNVWFDPTGEEIEVPTMSEFEALRQMLTGSLNPDAFDRGNFYTDSGLIRRNATHRVSTISPISFTEDVTLSVKSGFRFYISLVTNGSCTNIGWVSGYSVLANQSIALTIAREATSEDATETADISEFVEAMSVSSKYHDEIGGEQYGVSLVWSRGYLNASDGALDIDATYDSRTTNYIPVHDNDTFTIECEYETAHPVWVAYATYDENKNFIERIVLKTGSVTSVFARIIISSASYIRITSRVYEDKYPDIRYSPSKYYIKSDHIPYETVNNLYDSENISKRYIAAAGGFTRHADCLLVNDIPVSEGDVFHHLSVPGNTQNMGYAFYDSGYVFVSRITTIDSKCILNGKTYLYQKIVVPSGASYMATYANTGGKPAAYLYKENSNEATNKEIDTILSLFDQSFADDYAISATSPIVGIDHRGYDAGPENTLPAFILSRKNGYAYVECDVQFTSDGVPVILHDASINRTARNSDGTSISGTVNIASITYEQALEYDFGLYKSSIFEGTKIPSFREFILLCRNIGLSPVIEIKVANFTEAQVHELCDIVEDLGMTDKVYWQSYDVTMMSYVKEYKPSANVGIISSVVDTALTTALNQIKTSQNKVFANVAYSALTSENVQTLLNNGVRIAAWTVTSKEVLLGLNEHITMISADNYINPAIEYYKHYTNA